MNKKRLFSSPIVGFKDRDEMFDFLKISSLARQLWDLKAQGQQVKTLDKKFSSPIVGFKVTSVKQLDKGIRGLARQLWDLKK